MKWKNKSPKRLQTSILCICLMAFVVSFSVTAYLNMQNNRTLGEIEDTYFSNQLLMETQEVLQGMQKDVGDYLSTKGTDALTDYYDKENAFRGLMKKLNTEITGAEDEIMEKNIYYMAETYLEMSEKSIRAKRGRDIESYRQWYSSMTQQYEYLYAAIYTLNNQKFEKNSLAYEKIVSATQKNSTNNVILVSVVAALNIEKLLNPEKDADGQEIVSKNGGIGMRNFLKRLQLYYDKTDIMEITSLGKNMGTEVTLYLPIERSVQNV